MRTQPEHSGRRRRMVVRWRRVAAVAAALLATTALTEPTSAHEDSAAAIGINCHEFVAFPDVSYASAQALVPGTYQVRRDDTFGDRDTPLAETAKLFITARHCDRLEVDGKAAHDVIESYVAVPIYTPGVETFCEEPLDANTCDTVPGEPAPHKSGVTPLDPDVSPIDEAIPLEIYLVQWVTNSQLRATWLRRSTGLGDRVTVAGEDLVFDYDPVPCCGVPNEVNFTVTVPTPAPSPYRIEARMTEPDGLTWYAGTNQWWDTEDRTVIIFAEAPIFSFGLQDGGKITSTDPGSPLGKAFGSEQSRLTGGDGDKGVSFDAFSFNFYKDGRWTKCVRRSPSQCTPQAH